MIELLNIRKHYANRTVLDMPYVSFSESRRYALIGMNGCGKTTMLRILAGTLLPDVGECRGVPISELGYLPQVPYAFSFSVQKNVEMALKHAPDAPQHAAQALHAVGMHNLHNARGDRLSGGETQRMAFARMIARPHALLLLDEPTSAADIRGTDQIERALLDYASANSCTIILSTHSPAQALRLAQEILFLDQGKLVEQAPAERLLKSPQHASTHAFLQNWKI